MLGDVIDGYPYEKLKEHSYSVTVEELSEELQVELSSNNLSEEGLPFAIDIVDIT